ncbi:u11/u12 small nuclear ribonucleoprotein 35 kda protein [Quercus suber]|uniref:U11/u12 small nuclear ribonucleoprotein 35 kDa protein n=1 Tax=Quercus suber TaxID=58331 RepID=A0AAW0KF74_QUESU
MTTPFIETTSVPLLAFVSLSLSSNSFPYNSTPHFSLFFANDPFDDPKVIGDPYCTVFIGCLSHLTSEYTLHQVSSLFNPISLSLFVAEKIFI